MRMAELLYIFKVTITLYCILCLDYYRAVCQVTTEKRLYNDLFSNYTSFLRPLKEENYFKQITVNVTFFVNQIESLNEKEQKLTSHGYMYLSWIDEFLTWNATDYGGAFFLIVPADKVWLPEITPTNSVLGETELSSISEDVRVRILSEGKVVWIPSRKWVTACQVDVTYFPYDEQQCEIHYANWMYTAYLVNFYTVPEVPTTNMAPSLDWQVINITSWTEQIIDSDNTAIPLVKMRIYMKRDPTFFELNVLIPAMLLSFLMLPMFILPADSGEKISLGVTLMLAYSIFLLMMTDNTPKSGNTPRLTIVILICTIFSGLGVMVNVIILNIHHHRPDKAVPNWAKWLITDKLGKLLCCMNYANQDAVHPFIDNNEKVKEFLSDKKQQTYNREPISSQMSEIVEHLEFWKANKLAEDVVEINKDDWDKVARVIDRFFLWLYVTFIVFVFASVLMLKYS